MIPWSTWATATLQGIRAPVNDTNAGTLWAWSGAESLPRDRMSWCNPLNTTQFWPGSIDMNSVGVKRYATVQNGIAATVVTLLNGHYPVILANLRGSLPRAQWGLACANLGTWGTGCAWLATNYGPLPDSFGGTTDLTPEQSAQLVAIYKQFISPTYLTLDARFAALGKIAPVDIAALVNSVGALSTAVTVLDSKVNRLLKEFYTP